MENVNLENINVMYVKSSNGVQGSKEAFDDLERHLSTLKGRKFYGVLMNGKYKACVTILENDNAALPHEIIPGGKYAREKILDWMKNLDKIGPLFDSMAARSKEDTSRPRIEFYRSLYELILMLPVH